MKVSSKCILFVCVAGLMGCGAQKFEDVQARKANSANSKQFLLSAVLKNARTATTVRATSGVSCTPEATPHEGLVTILNDWGCPQSLASVNSTLAGRNAGNFVRICHVPPSSVDEAEVSGINSAAGTREELCVSLDALELYADQIPGLSNVMDMVGSCAPVCQCTNCQKDSNSTETADSSSTESASPCTSCGADGDDQIDTSKTNSPEEGTENEYAEGGYGSENKESKESVDVKEGNEGSKAEGNSDEVSNQQESGGNTSGGSSGCVPCGGYSY